MENTDSPGLPTIIVAILSTKGSVAKTIDTANLGGYLADQPGKTGPLAGGDGTADLLANQMVVFNT